MNRIQSKYEEELTKRMEFEKLCDAYAKDLEDRAAKSIMDKGMISRQDSDSDNVS